MAEKTIFVSDIDGKVIKDREMVEVVAIECRPRQCAEDDGEFPQKFHLSPAQARVFIHRMLQGSHANHERALKHLRHMKDQTERGEIHWS